VVALLLGALFDQIGLHWVNSFGYYDYPNTYGVSGESHGVGDAANLTTALANLLFVQTIAAPTFGSNSPLWSLANEFWYYAFIPLAVLLLHGSKRPLRLAGGLVLVAVALVWLPRDMLILASTWIAGAAAYLWTRPLGGGARLALLAAFVGIASVLRTLHPFAEFSLGEDLAVGAAFAALLWSLGRPAVRGAAQDDWAGRLAGFSYSLYLVHVPLLFLIAAASLQGFGAAARLQPGAESAALFAAAMATVLGLAYAVSRVTEARTDEVRRRLGRWLAGGASASASSRPAR
jgi:peptidoglycan/LPS O-acetylase OafA/YrhL